MKRMLCIIMFLTITFSPNLYTQSPYDLSFGYGAHHGGLGCQLTSDNLFFIGLGVLDSYPLIEVGLEYRFVSNDVTGTREKITNSPYIAISYGGIGVQTESEPVIYQIEPYTKTNSINGVTILGGYVTRLGDERSSIFLNFGLGYSYGQTKFF